MTPETNTELTIAQMQTREYAINRLRNVFLQPDKPVYTCQINCRYTAAGATDVIREIKIR